MYNDLVPAVIQEKFQKAPSGSIDGKDTGAEGAPCVSQKCSLVYLANVPDAFPGPDGEVSPKL